MSHLLDNEEGLTGDPSPLVKSLEDMARVGRGVAAIRHQHTSVNVDENDPPRISSTPKSLSRRSSRLEKIMGGDSRPEIVIDAPPDESLYPSLTTLGSLSDDEEEEFSCRECCKSSEWRGRREGRDGGEREGGRREGRDGERGGGGMRRERGGQDGRGRWE